MNGDSGIMSKSQCRIVTHAVNVVGRMGEKKKMVIKGGGQEKKKRLGSVSLGPIIGLPYFYKKNWV